MSGAQRSTSNGGLTLEPQPISSRIARHYVEAELVLVGLPTDVVETAMLLTSELVTNAVLHAGTTLVVQVDVAQGSLVVSVTDESTEAVQLQRVPPTSTHGRGIALVDRLATCWGVDRQASGKRVWFAMPRAPRVA